MTKRNDVSCLGNENISELIVMLGTQDYENTKCHRTVYFKWVNCTVYELYLSFFLREENYIKAHHSQIAGNQ